MFKKYGFVLLAGMFIAQPIFADTNMDSNSKPCKAIVKACLDAGYKRSAGEGKLFWKDCMEPVLLGKTVAKVSVDAASVKACRSDKIKELEQQLDALKKADK